MCGLAAESVSGAIHLPLGQLCSWPGELPRNLEIFVICRSGGRAYHAPRVPEQNGFNARTIAGSMLSKGALGIESAGAAVCRDGFDAKPPAAWR
jgi:rhodanese-related sulfurtransferase